MNKLRLLFFFFGALSLNLYAQTALTEDPEELTLQLYNEKKWNELIERGEKMIKDGGDAYLIRYRVAIAYYELKRYNKSAHHFKIVWEKTPNDKTVQEYLYYSYLFSGNGDEAELYKSKMDLSLIKDLGLQNFFLRNILAFASYTHTNNLNKAQEIVNNSTINYNGRGVINGGSQSAGLYLGLQPTHRLSIDVGGNFFITKSNTVQGRSNIIESKNTNTQLNIFVKYYIAKNLSLGAGSGLFLSNIPNYSTDRRTTPPTIRDSSSVKTFKSYSGFMSYRMGRLTPSVLISYSDLSFQYDLQGEFSLSYLPSGHIYFYGTSSVAVVQDIYSNKNVIFSQKLGGKLIGNIWGEAHFSYGNMSNYITNYNFTTYNTYDPIKYLGGLDISYHQKKYSLILGYQLQNREGTLNIFNANTQQYLSSEINPYFLHTIKLVAKWNI